MRYSYGIMDRKWILTYKPHLFHKTDDLLVFPSEDFQQWHSNLKEYIDGLYRINSRQLGDKSANIRELDLAMGVISNINDELEHLFDPKRTSTTPSYQYVSIVDPEYKKSRTNWYTHDQMKIDTKILVKPRITPWLKHQNMMEIVDMAAREFREEQKKRRKAQKTLTDLL